jgi:GNAT superfamily N-acetyltransferase
VRNSDAGEFARLAAETPDTGLVSFASRFQIDAYQGLQAFHGDITGVVAEAPGGGLAGAGLISFGPCRFEGAERPSAGLISFGPCRFEGAERPSAVLTMLMVHPRFRRMGLAARLVQWRVEFARRRIGADGVIFANIQQGNVGSQRTAGKWFNQSGGRLTVAVMRFRARPPRPHESLHIRRIEPRDCDVVAQHLNAFYEAYNFYRPHTGEGLFEWCRQSPFEVPFRHYFVITDPSNRIVAGLGIAEYWKIRTLHIGSMPPALRLLNSVLRMVPPDGVVRGLRIEKLWCAPGQAGALRHLFETIRWRWRGEATALQVWLDQRSALAGVCGIRPWSLKTHTDPATARDWGATQVSAFRRFCRRRAGRGRAHLPPARFGESDRETVTDPWGTWRTRCAWSESTQRPYGSISWARISSSV